MNKGLLLKISFIVGFIATVFAMNMSCSFFFYQPKVPKLLK